jgi:hypothetical protein
MERFSFVVGSKLERRLSTDSFKLGSLNWRGDIAGSKSCGPIGFQIQTFNTSEGKKLHCKQTAEEEIRST